MKETNDITKYATHGLLVKEGDKIEINFKKLIDAVIEGKDWSYFGGEEKPIKLYCPQENTSDGKAFYQFLLVCINEGRYPHNETERQRCEQVANQFMDSKDVISINIIERVAKVQDIGRDIYVMTERDCCECNLRSNIKFSIAYPTETVIKEVYYQINTVAGQTFNTIMEKKIGGMIQI